MMIDDESPEHSLCGISESEMPMDEGSKRKIWVVEVEIRAPRSESRAMATQTGDDGDERPGPPVTSSMTSNGEFVDEGYASCEETRQSDDSSRGDVDGDWEWVGES